MHAVGATTYDSGVAKHAAGIAMHDAGVSKHHAAGVTMQGAGLSTHYEEYNPPWRGLTKIGIPLTMHGAGDTKALLGGQVLGLGIGLGAGAGAGDT